jgi:hypothetical protein
MRSFFWLPACLLAIGCSTNNLTDECSSGSRTGTAPNCLLTVQCSNSNTGLQLDCTSSDAGCVCSENTVTGKTVPYQSAFCSEGNTSDFSTMEDTLDKANAACAWNL